MTDDAGTPQPKTSPADPPAANQNQDEPAAPTGADHNQVSGAADGTDDKHGVPVAGTYAVGSSGEGAPAGGGIPAVASPGKPDGEVDTRG